MAKGSAKHSGSQPAYKADAMVQRYLQRQSILHRWLRPPLPLFANPHESHLRAAQGAKLFVGGAGRPIRPGYFNLDLVCFAGVDVVADVECLPFKDDSIVAISVGPIPSTTPPVLPAEISAVVLNVAGCDPGNPGAPISGAGVSPVPVRIIR